MSSDARRGFDLDSVCKRYGDLTALGPLTLAIGEGERVAVVGPSGSGKTTLLHLLGGLIRPNAGSIRLAGTPMESLRPGRQMAELVGVMHQQYDLVPSLPVIHNVLAGRLGSWSLWRSMVSLLAPRESDRALEALSRVGIGDKLYERTSRLSGGEQQRVALARLLLQRPRAILADEPVSSVDPARAEDLIRMLVSIASEGDHTLIVSLHSVRLALDHFQRIIGLRGGQLAFDRAAGEITTDDLDALYALTDAEPELQPLDRADGEYARAG